MENNVEQKDTSDELKVSKAEICCLKKQVALLTSKIKINGKQDSHKLASIVESSNDAIISLELDGTIVSWNDAAEEIYGYTAFEIIGEDVRILVPDERHHEISMIFEKIAQGESFKRYETTRRKKDGSLIHVALSEFPIRDAKGKIQYCSAIVRDVTEMKLAEKVLQLSEERFSKAFDMSPVAMSIIRLKDYKFMEANSKFTELIGFTQEEIIGNSAIDLNIWYKAGILEKFRIALNKDTFVKNFKAQLRKKSGEKRLGLISAEIIEIVGEKCILSSIMDVTEQWNMEKELTRLHRLNLVGEMAAGIAHEIRNPLTTVRGFLQLLEEKEDGQQYREYYSLMLGEVDKANAIISEYLTLAKNKHVELAPHNLNSVIGRMTQLIKTESILMDKYIEVDLESVEDIFMNEKEISQLLLHLIRNGFEATNKGGKVSIRTYTEAGNVVLEIADNGYGIKPHLVEKIGLPFLTTKDKGTGLGLAVCYSIASRHNATIDFKTGETGTTFYVRFNTKLKLGDLRNEEKKELA